MKRQSKATLSFGLLAPPSRMAVGLIGGWLGVAAFISACILLGMNWAFQETASGLPTPVLAQPVQPVPVSTPDIPATLALPTAVAVSSPQTSGSLSGGAPTVFPNQDVAFGYGIEILLDGNVNSAMSQVVELGLGWVRLVVDWSAIQPAPDQTDWTALDRVMQAASSRGLKVLATIATAPDWTRSVTAEDKHGPPDKISQYADFASQVIERYRGSIHAVEIWNNANLDSNWYTAGGLNPSGYLNLLIPASQAIRQSDPGIVIISGALTPTGRNDGVVAIDDFVYLQQLIESGLLDYVDCVGVQHSGFNLSPTITSEDAFSGGMPRGTFFVGPYDTSNPLNPHHSWAFASTVEGAHNLVVAAQRETPLCVTSFGWAAGDGYGIIPAGHEFARDNSPQEQAEYIVSAFLWLRSVGFVRLAVLNNLNASQSSGSEITGQMLFSVIGRDGELRPAFGALREMLKTP